MEVEQGLEIVFLGVIKTHLLALVYLIVQEQLQKRGVVQI